MSTSTPPDRPAAIDPKLANGVPAHQDPARIRCRKAGLISRATKLAYPIRDGIPIILPEEARKLD